MKDTKRNEWLSSEFLEERVVPGLPGQEDLFREHMARYRFAKTYTKNKKVLDAGCGCGYGACFLAKEKAEKVIGVDISGGAIAYCQSHFQAPNLSFKKMDCTKLFFPKGSFDVVVSFEVIEHLKNENNFLKEIKRVLKSNGVFIISTPNIKRKWLVKNRFHLREYSPDALRGLLEKYFSKVTLYGQRYKSSILAQKEERAKKITRISSPFSKFIPAFLKDYLYPRFIYKYLLSSKDEDISINKDNKEEIEGSRQIIGVCYR